MTQIKIKKGRKQEIIIFKKFKASQERSWTWFQYAHGDK